MPRYGGVAYRGGVSGGATGARAFSGSTPTRSTSGSLSEIRPGAMAEGWWNSPAVEFAHDVATFVFSQDVISAMTARELEKLAERFPFLKKMPQVKTALALMRLVQLLDSRTERTAARSFPGYSLACDTGEPGDVFWGNTGGPAACGVTVAVDVPDPITDPPAVADLTMKDPLFQFRKIARQYIRNADAVGNWAPAYVPVGTSNYVRGRIDLGQGVRHLADAIGFPRDLSNAWQKALSDVSPAEIPGLADYPYNPSEIANIEAGLAHERQPAPDPEPSNRPAEQAMNLSWYINYVPDVLPVAGTAPAIPGSVTYTPWRSRNDFPRYTRDRGKKGAKNALHVMQAASEVKDALDCAWKAIPKKGSKPLAGGAPLHTPKRWRYYDPEKPNPHKKSGKGGWVGRRATNDKGVPFTTPKPYEMAQDLMNHWQDIDFHQMSACVQESAVTDAAIGITSGKAGAASSAAFRRTGFGFGAGIGPAL